ncbi:WXG100 family type VII secretion target [Allokutzneria sp. A3M-2-11 16]|uniref:WXG100 family type VII secretion target n=1 Tax=Allokutzneria sp. A3M-2-11 16 TaxID=2962043 RepID=UPI0020B873AC|nr:WXG100 family type VII secretion target [Allokutzneria sp. A3M-2-11 16]MCP3799110.1 WXG100 family type VII secretion target [Allokutzneria sp. A3M-2-11 16]
MTGPGSFAELNSAGNPKNWFEQAAGRGSSWTGAAQDLADATSPPEIAVATVSSRAEMLQTIAAPGKALADNGLGFLVSMVMSPFIEIVEWAIGDPEQMRATGEGWGKVAGWLDQAAAAERRRSAATEAVWVGAAATAFRAQMESFATAVDGLADDIRELKDVLDTIADLFDMLVEFVIETVTELVIGLIVQWLAAIAAAWVTAGVSTGVAMSATFARVGTSVAKVSTKANSMQKKLCPLVEKMEKLLVKLRGKDGLQQLLTDMDKRRTGGWFESKAIGYLDRRAPAGRIFSRAEYTRPDPKDPTQTIPGSLASTTENRFIKGSTGPTALAANISETILSSMVGGTTLVGRAATNAGIAVGTDAAIEKGAEIAYDKATDPKKSAEERRADQVRGFGLNGGTA